MFRLPAHFNEPLPEGRKIYNFVHIFAYFRTHVLLCVREECNFGG